MQHMLQLNSKLPGNIRREMWYPQSQIGTARKKKPWPGSRNPVLLATQRGLLMIDNGTAPSERAFRSSTASLFPSSLTLSALFTHKAIIPIPPGCHHSKLRTVYLELFLVLSVYFFQLQRTFITPAKSKAASPPPPYIAS